VTFIYKSTDEVECDLGKMNLQGEKEIRKESPDLNYLHNIHKVRLFTKYESHLIIPVRGI
jgi:hypothetical protein